MSEQRDSQISGRVTTVITSYNKGPFLAEAIQSALDQTYPSQEILVIDDGSVDNTREVMQSFEGNERVRCISQENQGQAAAKNRGIREATGEFVAFLDGDDRWRPEKLQKQVEVFQRTPALGLVYTDRLIFNETGVIVASNKEWHTLYRGWILDQILVSVFIPFSSVLARRSALFDAGLFDESLRVAVDYDLWLRFARKYEVDYVDEVLMEYRVGIDSIGSRVGNKTAICLDIQQKFIDRYYDGSYPNSNAVARSTAMKYSALGDYLLAQSHHGRAFLAYCKALRYTPLDLPRYKCIGRSLIPNRIARVLKSLAVR